MTGYLGHLTLNIPWSDLKGKPVRILIQDLFVLARLKTETEYDFQEDAERTFRLKKSKLDYEESTYQEMASGKLCNKNLTLLLAEMQNENFMTQLITKIADNIQLEIKNIHIRYEDKTSHLGVSY